MLRGVSVGCSCAAVPRSSNSRGRGPLPPGGGRLRIVEELPRVCDRGRGDLLPSEHASDFLDSALAVIEFFDAGPRPAFRFFLPDAEMGVAKTRDLGKVSHAYDLVVPGQLAEFPTDDLRHAAPNACVNLVKDQRGGLRSALDRFE